MIEKKNALSLYSPISVNLLFLDFLQNYSPFLNVINLQVFQELEGYTAYEERRRNKVNKQMAGGAVSNFDEGVARNTTQTPRSNL